MVTESGGSPGGDGPGTLYVVGTPIGNLGDITFRAVETLRAVGLIAAEDTRRTRALLSHLGITGTPLVSIESHVSDRAVGRVVEALSLGTSVALVTDAGMPAVSDPGARVVTAAARQGLPVTVVPGPSSITAAAALSGLVEGAFLFLGFIPRRGRRRSEALERIRSNPDPVILLEAPNRTADTLAELAALMPRRAVCVVRELTKLHEEAVRGVLGELEAREWRGEVCIVMGAGGGMTEATAEPEDIDSRIRELIQDGASTRTVLELLGRVPGQSKRDLYARIELLRAERDGTEGEGG